MMFVCCFFFGGVGVRAFKQLYSPYDWTKVLRGESELDEINGAAAATTTTTTSHGAPPKKALGPAVAAAPVDLISQLRRGSQL